MAPKEKIRIVIDTNVWIDFAVGHHVNRLKDILNNKNFKIYMCTEIENEFNKVTQSNKLKKYLNKLRIQDTIDLIKSFCTFKKLHSDIDLSRDKKDNFLLGFSINCNAHYLVTGDDDLLVLKKIKNTQIITFETFLNKIDYKEL